METYDFLKRLTSELDGVKKTSAYQNDEETQRILSVLNKSLQPHEGNLISQLKISDSKPILLIGYAPRSGSTILTQLLAMTRQFNYVSNLQARFWLAPYIGGKLEESIDLRNKCPVTLRSDYGRTSSPSEPHEFRYFWEYWLPFSKDGSHYLSREKWNEIDISGLTQEINAIRSLENLPLFFKKEWLGLNAGLFMEEIPNVKVLQITREPLYTAQSIYLARQRIHGSAKAWWGDKPSAYDDLKHRRVYEQIAGQINGIYEDMDYWERSYPGSFMRLKYEHLLNDIHGHLSRIIEFVNEEVPDFEKLGIPKQLDIRNDVKIEEEEIDALSQALRSYGM